MLRVGLTGGIGAGKSEVARRLASYGAVLIDADLLAREAVAPGSEGLAEVTEAFGPGVLAADGSLDREALAGRVFADDAARRRLEGIIHPRVRARAAELERAAGPGAIVVHDIPLLVETGQAGAFDLVLVVDAPDELRLARLVRGRGMDPAQARARLAAQADRQDRLDAADVVIDNSGSLEELDSRVRAIWEQLEQRRDAGHDRGQVSPPA